MTVQQKYFDIYWKIALFCITFPAIEVQLEKVQLAIVTEKIELLQLVISETTLTKNNKQLSLKLFYSKSDCIDDALAVASDRYDHLRGIRHIVFFEKTAAEILTEKQYERSLKLHYLELFLDLFEEEVVEVYRKMLARRKMTNIKKITQEIDNYYIKRITS